MSQLKVLGLCGSLRKHSTNMGLLKYAQAHAPAQIDLTIADLSEVPFYNADLSTPPAAAATLLQQFEAADALLLACPEYNYSLAPALKNALDWASRAPENRLLHHKPVAIMGAAGGMGSSRAQYHLRQVCVFLNLHPLNKPEVFSNAFSNSFDATGQLVDEKVQQLIQQQLAALYDWSVQLGFGRSQA
ncbi:NADPH-dependent FMN reductase [Leeia aquatica]|uniref:NAD(P)H-dependent oxidoreductase n=1 Tax=Leeia aquatica TaxID=2725557 RepID=A0A847S7F8_9NEIS|nr:NAD(P)H-dependent oxidoreductase [Leeia aquatica]NLR75693.1 NAD(P)H-dependent oxidoreductase [Leeia aquatica]